MEIGKREIKTQKRLLNLFDKQLGYTCLGDWTDRENNSNVEEEYLRKFLTARKLYSSAEINSAINQLKHIAGNISAGLYHANKAVYNLLRYGVNVSAEASENKKYVHLIDWAFKCTLFANVKNEKAGIIPGLTVFLCFIDYCFDKTLLKRNRLQIFGKPMNCKFNSFQLFGTRFFLT